MGLRILIMLRGRRGQYVEIGIPRKFQPQVQSSCSEGGPTKPGEGQELLYCHEGLGVDKIRFSACSTTLSILGTQCQGFGSLARLWE